MSTWQALAAGWVVSLGLAASVVAQQPDERPTQPDLLAPSPATTQPPARSELTLEQRADIFMARKSYPDAVDFYRRALKGRGNADPPLWNKLGIAYQQQMDYRAARRAYQQAVRYGKTFAEPWNNLGTTYFLENKVKKSIKFYQRAIKINSANASFHLNLGTSLYYRKKFAEAVAEYRTALTLDPNVLTDRSSVGTVLQARGADAKYYFYLAKVFASLGRAEEAVRYLRRALEDGFKDLKSLDEDSDFQRINQYPAYVELRNNLPIAIH